MKKGKFDAAMREVSKNPDAAIVVAVLRALQCSACRRKEVPVGKITREVRRVRLIMAAVEDGLETFLPPRTPILSFPENRLELLAAAWRACFGTEPTSAREAVERASSMPPLPSFDQDLADVLKEIAAERGGGLSVRRLGKWMQKHAGRRIGGKFFIKDSERDHVALWRVSETETGGEAQASGDRA